jgi:uncharacterized protein
MTTSPLRLATALALAGIGLVSACGPAGTTTTARSAPAISGSATPGTTWVAAQAAAAQQAGQLTAAQAASLTRAYAAGVARLRATGTIPPGLPAGLTSILNPANALFLSQADRYDPAGLAARLTPNLPVLVSCSAADHQVTCGEVRHLLAGLADARADTDFVRLTGVDHVLKQDPVGSAVGYAEPLPFSPQLQQALRAFVEQHLLEAAQ